MREDVSAFLENDPESAQLRCGQGAEKIKIRFVSATHACKRPRCGCSEVRGYGSGADLCGEFITRNPRDQIVRAEEPCRLAAGGAVQKCAVGLITAGQKENILRRRGRCRPMLLAPERERAERSPPVALLTTYA